MVDALVFVLVVLPFVAAALCWLLPGEGLRRLIVLATGAVLAVASLMLLGGGAVSFTPTSLLGIPLDPLITVLDFGLLLLILYLAWRMKHPLAMGLTLLQLLPLAIFEFGIMEHGAVTPAFYIDQLSLVMVTIISIIGSAICIYALPYMKEHEHHLHLDKSRQPRFFFFLVLFLGAMNGLVMANNIMWLYFFWEITTLCSFMLIGHDASEIALKNASRALWMNLLGGVGFVLGIIALYKTTGTLSLQHVIQSGALPPEAMMPLLLLVFAGFTKAAQVPFQSWLTGAMVAPTPVSALLHSSTMVKAGVYLIVRLAPAYQGTTISTSIALFGAFTFLVTSALAVGQSNGKKILAYSTIANLGLIIACAGVNTPAAITAAIMLIIFHAISKGLLFLCVGSIEQYIGSRDIEDMRGLYDRMPRTAMITIIGVMTMLLPPFGVLLAKWMAIQASSHMLLVVLFMAAGSALNVVFWTRWAGMLLSSTFKEARMPETQDGLMRLPLVLLAGLALFMGLLSPPIYNSLVDPVLQIYYKAGAYSADMGGFLSPEGTFAVYPLFLVLGLGFLWAVRMAKKTAGMELSAPYMCGEAADTKTAPGFRSPYLGYQNFMCGNYYLASIFGEEKLSVWINAVGAALIAMMIGGVL